MMNIIWWVVFGAIAGFLADMLDRSVVLSWPERIIVGIVGAFVGGFIANLISTGSLALTASNDFNLMSIILAVVGGLVALFIYKRMRRT